MVRRLATIGVLMVGSLWGQRSDTIWQQLSNTSVTPTLNFISPPVNNIGQSGHTMYISVPQDIACNPSQLQGGMQYSFDNTNWTSFGNWVPTNTNNAATVIGTGAYPYVRANFTYQGCVASVFYTGVLAAPFTLTQGTLPLNTQVNFSQTSGANYVPQPVLSGSVYAWDDGGSSSPGGIIGVNYEALSTVPISVSVGTSGKITQYSTGTNAKVYVTQIILTADTNATVITLKEGLGATCGSNTLAIGSYYVNAGIPLNLGKIRTTNPGYNLCIGAATGSVTGSITYGMINSPGTGALQ